MVSVLALSVLSVACSKEGRNDYCKNHYLFHTDHQDTLGELKVRLDDAGLVQANLFIPSSVFGTDVGSTSDALEQLAVTLQYGQTLLRFDTDSACEPGKVIVQHDSTGLQAQLESTCGESNRLKQMNVTLLDHIPELDEIEVEVTTPVTFKHFAISRQCESAIFRLNLPGNDDEQK
jgi:hypothetical protein